LSLGKISGSSTRKSSSTVWIRISRAWAVKISDDRLVGQVAPVNKFWKRGSSCFTWNMLGYRVGRYVPSTKVYSSLTADRMRGSWSLFTATTMSWCCASSDVRRIIRLLYVLSICMRSDGFIFSSSKCVESNIPVSR